MVVITLHFTLKEGYVIFKEEWVSAITIYGTNKLITELKLVGIEIMEDFNEIFNSQRFSEKIKADVLVNILIAKIYEIRQYEILIEYLRNNQLMWPISIRLEQIGELFTKVFLIIYNKIKSTAIG